MMKTFILIAFAAVLQAQTPAGDASVGNVALGKDLFGKKYMCYTCHGWDGHGGSGAQLSGTKMSQNDFMAYVRSGGPGEAGRSGRMPAYSPKVIPDADLINIFAYIKTFPAARATKDIPLLNQIRSQN